MAGNYSIKAIIGIVTDKLKQGLAGAKSKVQAFGKSFSTAINNPAVQAFAQAGKAAVDFGVEAVKSAGEIDAKMNEVFTLLPGITGEAKKKMTKEMLALSSEMGKMPHDMIGSLYNALSAGVPQDNVFDFLKSASKASIAGVSTTEEAVGALTTVLNGYKMPAKEAGNVSDTLFTIIKNGVTTMPELAANIGKVTPIAASLGVSFDEVGAAFAEMTKNLGPGKSAETGTMLKNMFAELSKAGSTADTQFQRIAGKSFPEFIKSGGSTVEALKLMSAAAEKTGSRITDMFGSVEAGQAALILSTDGAKGFSTQLGEMGKKAGATDAAFKTVDQGFARMMEKLMSGFEAFKHTVGTALKPVVDVVMPLFLKGLKMIQALPWGSLGGVLGDIAKEMEPIIEAVFDLVKELFPLLPPLIRISTLTMKMGMPILMLLVKLLTKLMPVIVWLIDKVAWLTDLIGSVFMWLTKLVEKIFDWGDTSKKEVEKVEKKGKGFWEKVKGWVEDVMKWLKEFLPVLRDISEWIVEAAKLAWQKGSGVFGFIKKIYNFVMAYINTVKKFWDILLNGSFEDFKAFIGELIQKVVDFGRKIVDRVKEMARAVIDKILAIREKIFEWFPWLGKIVKWWEDKVKRFFSWLWGMVKPHFERIKNFLLETRSKLLNKFLEAAKKVFDFVQPIIKKLWKLIKAALGGVIDTLKAVGKVAGAAFGALKSAAGVAGKAISGAAKAAGWLGKKLGLVKEKTEEVNSEIEKTEQKQKAVTQAAEETVEAKKKEAEAAGTVTTEQEKQKALAAEKAQADATASLQAMAQAEQAAAAAAAEKHRAFIAQDYVKKGAEIIKNSKVNVNTLVAAANKHKEINSLADLYSLVASGKKTPAQIIAEAGKQQIKVNREGKKFNIQNGKGKTPAQQVAAATGQQKKLNEEAKKNPMLDVKNGKVTVKATVALDPRVTNIIIQQIALVHRDLLKIDKTLSGKFVNQ